MAFPDIGKLFTGGYAQDAANAQITGINAGLSKAIPLYQEGRTYSDALLNQAIPYWSDASKTATQGIDAYRDATGGGGAAGTQRALDTFFQSPDYLARLKAGNNALLAQGAATGNTGSGTELKALSDYGQGTAGAGYSDYVKNLAQWLPYGTEQSKGVTGTLNSMATLGQPEINNQAAAYYGGLTGIGNANANAALGQQTGAQNLLNLGTNLFSSFLGAGGPQKIASGVSSLFDRPTTTSGGLY